MEMASTHELPGVIETDRIQQQDFIITANTIPLLDVPSYNVVANALIAPPANPDTLTVVIPPTGSTLIKVEGVSTGPAAFLLFVTYDNDVIQSDYVRQSSVNLFVQLVTGVDYRAITIQTSINSRIYRVKVDIIHIS